MIMRFAGRTLAVLVAVIFTTALFNGLFTSVVFAGELNSAEQSIMEFAHGTFEYKGKLYCATQEAIDKAYAKMMEDDVDLTEREAENYKRQALHNIKKGIREGYLVLVEEETTEDVSQNIPYYEELSDADRDAEDDDVVVAKDGKLLFRGEKIIKNTGYYTGDGQKVICIVLVVFFLTAAVALWSIRAEKQKNHEINE